MRSYTYSYHQAEHTLVGMDNPPGCLICVVCGLIEDADGNVVRKGAPPRRIRTTEPTADMNGVIHPAGTVARLVGEGRFTGHDFQVEGSDAVLWSLVPVQYEPVEDVGISWPDGPMWYELIED